MSQARSSQDEPIAKFSTLSALLRVTVEADRPSQLIAINCSLAAPGVKRQFSAFCLFRAQRDGTGRFPKSSLDFVAQSARRFLCNIRSQEVFFGELIMLYIPLQFFPVRRKFRF